MRERIRGQVSGADGHPVEIDEYVIEQVLGTGGMGIVYAARERHSGERVALKMLRNPDIDRAWLQREFRATADLHHENLVTLHWLRADGPRAYFTMELIDGLPLLSHLRRAQASDATDASGATDAFASTLARLGPCLLQLCDALDFLHARGCVHGDIKPSNCHVTPEGRLVLLDFGLSRGTGDALIDPVAERVAGTPGYMAPELFEAAPPSPASDFYAVGALLHHALTGDAPFVRSAISALLSDKRAGPPPLVASAPKLPSIPPAIVALRDALLDPDPARRPGTDAIRAAIDDLTWVPEGQRLPHASSTRPMHLPFVGRQSELSFLRVAQRAARGRQHCVVVDGRSGVGKSALVDHFLSHHVAPDSLVLRSRCHERESVPHQAFDGIVAQLAAHLRRMPVTERVALPPSAADALAQIFPVLAPLLRAPGDPGAQSPPGDPTVRRQVAAGALFSLLARVGAGRPMVLWMDDLQWADRDSVRMLRQWLSRPTGAPCLLICSFRSESRDSSAALQRLFPGGAEARPADAHLRLEPLPRDESQRLLDLLRGQSDALPLQFAVHVLDDVGEVIDEHLAQLSPTARGLLDTLAVAGGPIAIQDGLSAAGLDTGRPAMHELRFASMLRFDGPAQRRAVEIFHDRLREAVKQRLAPPVRAAIHGKLARTLSEAGADDEVIYYHYRGAGAADRALYHGERALDRAADALAFERGVALSAELLQLSDSVEVRRRLRRRHGDMLQAAGHGRRAAETYLELAAAEPVRAASLELRLQAASELLFAGHLPEAEALFIRLFREIGVYFPRTPYDGLVSLLLTRAKIAWLKPRVRLRSRSEIDTQDVLRMRACWAAAQGMYMIDVMRGAKMASTVYEYALRTGDAFNLASSYAAESLNHALRGPAHWPQVQHLLDQARATAVGVDDPYVHAWTDLMASAARIAIGDMDEGVARCKMIERTLLQFHVGKWSELSMCRHLMVDSMMLLGHYAEARERVPALMDEALARGHVYDSVMLRSATSALSLVADRPVEAGAELDAIARDWPGRGYQLAHHRMLFGRIWVLLYRGEGRLALQAIEKLWPRFRRSLWGTVAAERRVAWTARGLSAALACQQGAGKDALRVARRSARALQSLDYRSAPQTGLSIEAALLRLDGKRAAAAELYARAAEEMGYTLRPLQTAALWLRHGALRDLPADHPTQVRARAEFVTQGVENPAAFITLMAP